MCKRGRIKRERARTKYACRHACRVKGQLLKAQVDVSVLVPCLCLDAVTHWRRGHDVDLRFSIQLFPPLFYYFSLCLHRLARPAHLNRKVGDLELYSRV